MPTSHWIQFRNIVKSSSSCIDYLHSRGFNVSRPGQCIHAPAFIRPSDSSPSFAVYEDNCFDFATSTSYDIIDLCALDQFNGDKTQALEFLAGKPLPKNYSQLHSSLYSEQAKAFSDRVDYWHSELLKNPIVSPNGHQIHLFDYLLQRGFSQEHIASLKLGYSPKIQKLMIPFFNRNHQPVYVSGRDMSGANDPAHRIPKYWYIKLDDEHFSEILDKCIFGIDSVRPGFISPDTMYDPEIGQVVKLSTHHIKYDYLAVCEGMLDVLSFRAAGWSAITGKISSKQEREFLDICRQYRDKGQRIFICFDSDPAGRDFQKKMALLLFKHSIPFVAGHLPKSITVTRQERSDFGQAINIKDVNDYFAAGGSLDELVQNAADGMLEIARICKDEDELQERFTEGARCCDRWQLHKLKNYAISIVEPTGETTLAEDGKTLIPELAHKFNPKNVGFMYAEAMRPMQDCDIAKIVEDKHRLVYDTLGQFYEYTKGVWKAMNDLLIQKEIIQVMNGHISAQKVSGVCKYLKIDLADDVHFNTKHNVVFQNGTLWLDEEPNGTYDDPQHPLYGMPKNFKPSSPEDLSTIQVSYNYDPKAHNSVLERVANEWTRLPDGRADPLKFRLLKQMFGYILFVKNTLQKFFVLKGDGANGKSTCMHCIEAILGKENTTSLQISRLSSEFDPVVLKHSRVNLCYDAQASIEQAQEVLKAIIGGDQITAAHKGVDAESFSTNAKFIVSANKFFSANDVSRGLLRRMLFIAFNNTFDPKVGETSVEDEIMKDLPGLFNFAYEGYKDLKQSGYFVETEEQAALLEEFREQLSPLILFAREELYPVVGRNLNDREVYALYREWCVANGEKALGRTKFIPEIRQVIRTDGNIIPNPYRDKDTREWIFTFPAPKPDDKHVPDEPEDEQKTEPRVPAHSTRQEVQEVSTRYEQKENQVVKESAPVHSAPVHGEQTATQGQTQRQTHIQSHESRQALQGVNDQAESQEPAYIDSSRQVFIDGSRIKLPDPKKDNFPYDESSAWGLFHWLKRFGLRWQSKLSEPYSVTYGDDKICNLKITTEALQNLGLYLKRKPDLKAFLPGVEALFEF